MVYLRNKKDFDAGLLLSQSLSCKTYKNVHRFLLQNFTKTKIYDVHLGLQLIRPVTRGAAGEAKPPPEKFSPPWKNMLDIV